MSIKFRRDRPEETCGNLVPRDADPVEVVCLRIKGHQGDCVAMARSAGEADGVCWDCRNPLGHKHETWCQAR